MIYKISFERIVENYIDIDDSEFSDIEIECINSEPQHISTHSIMVNTSDNSGLEFPDFYYNGAVPLVSYRFKRIIEELNNSYVFYKDVYVKSRVNGKVNNYYLALPPRIDCMNIKESIYEILDDVPYELRDVSNMVIDESKTTNYDIFKIDYALDNSIYISERLKKLIVDNKLKGVGIQMVDSA